MNAEMPPLAGPKDVELETEALRAADRLEAVAEEYRRRGQAYPAMRILSLCRQAQEIVAAETTSRIVRNE